MWIRRMRPHGGFTNASDFAKSAANESPTARRSCPCRKYCCERGELTGVNQGVAVALGVGEPAAPIGTVTAVWLVMPVFLGTVWVEATPTAIPPMAMTNPPKIYARTSVSRLSDMGRILLRLSDVGRRTSSHIFKRRGG